MAKKNPYIFTIGFNSSLPEHIRVTEILNGTSEKAQLIANAILSYLGEKEGGTSSVCLSSIQPLVESMIQKEIRKALRDNPEIAYREDSKKQEEIVSLIDEQELPMDNEMTKNITDAMSAFRRMK